MKKPSLLDLRPCQFVLGMKEVENKIQKMEKMSKAELARYTRDHVIPVVKGRGGELYVIDHHHFARACWELDYGEAIVELIADLSRLPDAAFWDEMVQRGWVYLHDQFGLGPHSPSSLPADIRCLADDPFRSLAWMVIDEGGIKKAKIPFFEFQWAAFFRLNLDLALHSKSDFKLASRKALKLARSKAAKRLPGFMG